MQASNPNLIIDFSWISNVYMNVLSNLTYNGYNTGMFYGVYNFTKKLHKSYPNMNFHFCLDSFCKWRKELNPAYKANRDEVPKIQSQDFIDLCRILKTIPNTYFYKEANKEADDLIAILAMNLSNVIIYSGDNDMIQLLPLGVKLADKYKNGDFIYKDSAYTEKRYGLAPYMVKYYKFLFGDKSDNLPKVTSRIPDKDLKIFASLWYSQGFQKALKLMPNKKLVSQINENLLVLKNNIKLMDLTLANRKQVIQPIEVTADATLFSKYGIQR